MTKRMFPSYTLAELKKHVLTATGETKAKIEAEIAAREAGISKPKKTPVIDW